MAHWSYRPTGILACRLGRPRSSCSARRHSRTPLCAVSGSGDGLTKRVEHELRSGPLLFAMAKPVSPYRSLPPARRLALVTHFIKSSPQARELYVQRMASRPGGFRVVTLRSWSPDRLAAEVVRLNAQNA